MTIPLQPEALLRSTLRQVTAPTDFLHPEEAAFFATENDGADDGNP